MAATDPVVGPPQAAEAHDHALRKGTIGLFGIVFFVLAAAAPMAGMTGVLPVAIVLGNGAGAAGSYVVVGIVLMVFAVGYAAMSAHMTHVGAFMAYVGRGLGTPWGVASSYVSSVAYNAVQLCVYGFFGAVFGAKMSEHGIDLAWYWWALIVVVIVQVLAMLRVDIGAKTLGVLLTVELASLVLTGLAVMIKGGPEGFDFGASFSPSSVLSGAPGIALAFAFASFIGFEATAIYGEESKDPKRTVPRATYLAVAVITAVFALTSFGVITGVGASKAAEQAAALSTVDGAPLVNPAEMLFSVARTFVGDWLATLMSWLLLSSLFAAILAFHNAAARYFYAMGRVGLLPSALGRTSRQFRTPVNASTTQSVLAVVIIIFFAAFKLDPVLNLFYWGSGLAVIAINLVQALVCLAIIKFFRDTRLDTNPWRTIIAPALGFLGIVWGEVLLVSRFGLLTGTVSGDGTGWFDMNYKGWIIILLSFVVLAIGLVVGYSRRTKDNSRMVEEFLS